ncbi:hypothetical protein KJ632_04375 [Patescibacteria group bacterium]|nr:hypothetical protein [Patescibacteria group bacterium]
MQTDFSKSGDDDLIDLRSGSDFSDEPEFKIERVEEDARETGPGVSGARQSSAPEFELKQQVKVKFDKFVSLVTSKDPEDIFEKYEDEDVIVSTNLLADLASVKEEKEDRRVPTYFLVGILLGILVTWLIVKL